MKGKIFLAGNALALAIFAACSWSADPAPDFGVEVVVLVDGVTYASDAGAPPIPADTLQARVVAKVTAPPGDWQLQLSADGSLAFPGADAGAASATVHALGAGNPVEVQFAAAPRPTGEAVVRASLGALTRSFRFVVVPVLPRLTLCEADVDGGCLPPGGEIADAGAPPADDAGVVAWNPFPSSGGTLRDGDRAVLMISTELEPKREGVTWTGSVTTDGVLWFFDGDKPTRSRTIQFTQGSGPVVAPVRIVGAGAGSAFASIGQGPQTPLFLQTESASVVWRRVEYLEHVGLRARTRVSLCSTRLSGSLRASLDLDGGAVFPAEVPLSLSPGGWCVDPYPGQADFIWTGSQALPIWTVLDEASDASTLVAVPMLGTDASVQVKDVTLSWLTDAGASGATAQVTGTLWRNAYQGTSGERLGSTDVTVKAQTGTTANPASFTTDASGFFSFELVKTDWTSASVLFEVDHRLTVLVVIKP